MSTPQTPRSGSIIQQMGGVRGLVDSALPVIIFVTANSIGGLGWGIGAALAAAVAICVLRILRRESLSQAIGGVFGVGIAAFIAYRTGSARGYFLLGIWQMAIYAGLLLASIILRWPLIGVMWEYLNGRGRTWRANRGLLLRYSWATALWALLFVGKFVVQRWLYDENQVGYLAVARIVMGLPLTVLTVIGTVWIIAAGSGTHWKKHLSVMQNKTPKGPEDTAVGEDA